MIEKDILKKGDLVIRTRAHCETKWLAYFEGSCWIKGPDVFVVTHIKLIKKGNDKKCYVRGLYNTTRFTIGDCENCPLLTVESAFLTRLEYLEPWSHGRKLLIERIK